MQQWKTVSRETILDRGKYLRVENHQVQLPDGKTIGDWTWVITPDAAIVVPLLADGRFVVFRQTKYAVEGVTLAPPGGMLNEGENPLDGAKRELLEETGLVAKRWIELGSFVVNPNRGVGKMHLFLACDAEFTTEPNSDDLEEQEMLLMTQTELEAALLSGEFKVIIWTAAVAMALHHLQGEALLSQFSRNEAGAQESLS